MFNLIANGFKSLFSNKKNSLEMINWFNNASIEEKKEKIKSFDSNLYDWLDKAKQYIPVNNFNNIINLAVQDHLLQEYYLPEIISQSNSMVNVNDVNNALLRIENQKLKELDEMNWRAAFNKNK